MNRSEFEVRLHACLDARMDPFDDAVLVAWLDAHPEELDAVARLWAAVGVLCHESPVTSAAARPLASVEACAVRVRGAANRRWPLLVLCAGLAGVAAALVLATLWPAHAAPPSVAPPAAGRILSAVVEPITPTLGLAPQVRATEVLVSRPDVRVEVFTQWSVR